MSENNQEVPVLRKMEERRLLVTVSERKEHLLGLQFVSGFLSDHQGVTVELFFLLPPRTSPQVGLYGTPMNEGHMEESIFEMHVQRGKEAVQEAKTRLTEEGFPETQIGVKYEPPKGHFEWSILDEVRRGDFDAVVIGNRGRSWLEGILEGEMDIGDELLHSSCAAPLWICSRPRDNAQGVLLCLDGSEMSFRMAHHVGRMLHRETRQRVLMLRIKRSTPAGTMPPEDIFARGAQILAEEGVSEERIEKRIVESNDVVKSVLQEAEAGNFAVVAAGRSGVGKGLMEKIFMGSVTQKLFHKLKGSALWVQC